MQMSMLEDLNHHLVMATTTCYLLSTYHYCCIQALSM